jgi:hypothetical protein
MFKFQAPKNEKAMFRVGQKVTCDYWPGVPFKIHAKEFGATGAVFYTIRDTRMDARGGSKTAGPSGIRQKYLNKV